MTTTPKEQKPSVEEIEWTDEDDAIMDQVMADLRAKGVKADPVYPVKKPVRATEHTNETSSS